MTQEDQPLDQEPQDTHDDFDAAFGEYAGAEPDDDTGSAPAEDDHRDDGAESHDDEQPDISERLSQLEQENQRLKHSEASQRGRLGAYQRQINDLTRQAQTRQQQEVQAGGREQHDDNRREAAAQEMGSEDWQAFKEDFPDMARAVEARLDTDRQQQAELQQQLQQLQSTVQPIQQQAYEQQVQAEYARLEDRHNDWQGVVQSRGFQQWLQQQNPAIQQLADSQSADDASALLDFYKQLSPGGGERNTAPAADKRQSRLASAQTVSRRGAAQRSGTPDDFDAAFAHYAAKQARQP